MSEHPPQTSKNHEKESPDETTEVVRDSQFRKDQIDANHINEHSGGKGVSPETVKEYYRRLEMSPEELSALKENSEKDDSVTELSPEGSNEETKEKAVVEARDAVDEAIGKDDEATPDNSDDETLELKDENSKEADPETDPNLEAVAAKRASIQQRIDEADKISSKEARLEALEAIAKENMQEQGDEVDNVDNFTFPDLAIEAAVRIKDSKHHKGFSKWRLGRTKKVGTMKGLYNELLEDISNANPDSMLGVEAAQKIDISWLRNETVLRVGQHAITELRPLQEVVSQSQASGGGLDEQALFELNKYTHIAESVKSEIKGRHSRKYNSTFDASIAAHSMGPAYLDVVSNFHFHKKQKALYDMAVNGRNEKIAASITYPWLKKKALNEIRQLNALSK